MIHKGNGGILEHLSCWDSSNDRLVTNGTYTASTALVGDNNCMIMIANLICCIRMRVVVMRVQEN